MNETTAEPIDDEAEEKRAPIPPPAKLTIVGMGDLTFDEMEIFEESLGVLPDSKAAAREVLRSIPKTQLLKVLILISARRDNPDVTMEDVGRWPIRSIDIGGQSIEAALADVGPFDGSGSETAPK